VGKFPPDASCGKNALSTEDRQEYTAVERLFFSAITDFSTMTTSRTADTLKSLKKALFKSVTQTRTDGADRIWIQQTYRAMRRFARCHWSPLAVPLPFNKAYKQRQTFGSHTRRQVASRYTGWSKKLTPFVCFVRLLLRVNFIKY